MYPTLFFSEDPPRGGQVRDPLLVRPASGVTNRVFLERRAYRKCRRRAQALCRSMRPISRGPLWRVTTYFDVCARLTGLMPHLERTLGPVTPCGVCPTQRARVAGMPGSKFWSLGTQLPLAATESFAGGACHSLPVGLQCGLAIRQDGVYGSSVWVGGTASPSEGVTQQGSPRASLLRPSGKGWMVATVGAHPRNASHLQSQSPGWSHVGEGQGEQLVTGQNFITSGRAQSATAVHTCGLLRL